MDTSSILKQLVQLQEARNNGEPAAREQMLIAAQTLVASLQTPSEFISSVGWAEPARFACLRTAVDLQIFDNLGKSKQDGVSISALAEVTHADVALIGRIMKHLKAMNVVAELAEDVYANTSLSEQLVQSEFRDGLIYCYDVAGPCFQIMPSFFSTTGYQQPSNPTDGPFQKAHNTASHFFPWLVEHPRYLEAFGNYMAGYRSGKHLWFETDFYLVQDRLINGYSPSPAPSIKQAPFLVDVGGGKGHDLTALLSSSLSLPGSLVLQDRPEVISSIEPPLPAAIQSISHDFFEPQPASFHGARAYFLHSVLHDWDDDNCIKILKALRSALIPGYSKVLVHDLVIPSKEAAWSVTSMDWLMMALGSVRERTENDFHRLFRAAGLQVQKIWLYEQGTEALIEAVLPP